MSPRASERFGAAQEAARRCPRPSPRPGLALSLALSLACAPALVRSRDTAAARAAVSPPAAASAAAGSIGWVGLANTVFEHLGQHDGLPHAIATAVTEDAQGYLWAGTQDGVARWDGYRFRVYPARPDDPHGLPVSYVRTLERDSLGRIWVGMDGGGVARFDPAIDGFIRFGGATVISMAPDHEGGMWVATANGLTHVRASGTMEDAWPHAGKGPDALPEPGTSAVLQDRAGDVWIGSTSGLVLRHPDGRRGRRIELPGGAGRPIPVDMLYQDARGQVWIGTSQHGVFVLDPATDRIARLQPAAAADPGLLTDSVTSFAENENGEVWVGTQTRGLVIADVSSLLARRVVRDRSVPSNLQSNWIWGLHRDRGGQMWVASTAGLSRTRPQQDAILSLFSSDGTTWRDPYVFAIDADARGTLTLGQKSGLELIDPAAQTMVPIAAADADAGGLPPIANVTAVVHTADGTRWMASRDGLFTQAPGGAIRPVPTPGRGAVKGITALALQGGKLWIGGRGDGLWTLDLATHALAQPVPLAQLSDPEVTAFAADADGAMWVATNNGLNLVRKDGSFERIMPRAGDRDGLSSAVINSLLIDRRGRLWVGNNAGVQVLLRREADGRAVFHRIAKAQGLTSENIDTVLMDSRGQVWASTDDGIAVIDPDTFALRVLHPADGAAISTYWVNSGAVGPTGELFFGGLGGLTVVRPERLAKRSYDAPLVVTDVELGGKPVALREEKGRGQLVVPPEAGGFAVEFSLLDFSAPERNRYAYWLEGYDKGWREVDPSRRTASYTNLAPGRYVLHMKAASGDGTWTPHPLALDVQILPAWHQTWWFDVLKVLGALLAVAGVVAVRLRYVQRRSQELEHLVEVRTQELMRLQRQLEELAYSDALTGLPNRRMFGDHCRRMTAAADRQGGGFALLLIDLDHFKQVNDTLGHDAGDALLVETARRLHGIARQADVVARLGGDEFAILLDDTVAASAADIVCARILEAFDAPVFHQGKQMHASPSIGVALFPRDGLTQDALYKSADVALYAAKASGRHTWRFAGRAAATEPADA